MKRAIFMILMMVLLTIPLFAATGEDWGELGRTVLMILSPLIIGAASALGAKLFKKLGIDVDDTIIERVFAEILQFILKAEKSVNMTAQEKFTKVVDRTYAMLTKKQKAVLEKRYGSVENAVEVAFQRSSVAAKPTKK